MVVLPTSPEKSLWNTNLTKNLLVQSNKKGMIQMLLYAVVEQYDNGDDWEDRIEDLTVRGLFTDGNSAEQHLEDGVNPEEWKLVEQKDGYRSYQDRERRYRTLVRYVSKVTTDTMHEDVCGLFPWL